MKVVAIAFCAALVIAGCASVLPPEKEAYLEKVRAFPTDFSLPKSAEHDAWGRAQSFVAKYSSMKLLTVTEFVIDTYAPVDVQQIGYTITKTPRGDSIDISVKAWSGPGGLGIWEKDRDNDAHILAWYIKSGELPYPDLIYR